MPRKFGDSSRALERAKKKKARLFCPMCFPNFRSLYHFLNSGPISAIERENDLDRANYVLKECLKDGSQKNSAGAENEKILSDG